MGKVRQICFALNPPCTLFFRPYMSSAEQIQNILYILNIGRAAMCVKSEIEIPAFNLVEPTRFMHFRLLHHW